MEVVEEEDWEEDEEVEEWEEDGEVDEWEEEEEVDNQMSFPLASHSPTRLFQ